MAARTDIYQPTMSADGAMVQPGNRGQRISSVFAEAAPEIARGASDIANVSMSQLDDDARAWAVNAQSQADMSAAEILENKKRSAVDGAPEFKKSVLEDWKKYQDESMKNAPNNMAKQYLQTHLVGVNEKLSLQADAFQSQEIDRWRTKQVADGVDADARLLSSQSYDTIDQEAEKSLGKWATYYKTLQVEPGEKSKLMEATKEKIANAANMRKIEADPQRYLLEHSAGRNPANLAADPSAPRGIRNNNPGNLRTTEFAGTTGADKEGYGKFSTPEAGLRAMAKNLVTQQDKHGLKTVEGIISKYAPPNENDTAAYISTVSAALGVKPDQAINLKDPAVLQKMMSVMIKQENGVQPYSALQIAHGADAALNGKKVEPLNGATPDAGGHVVTSATPFNVGTWEQQQKWINLAETEVRRQETERKQKAIEANTIISGVKERMQSGLSLPADEMEQISSIVAATGDPKTSKKWLDLRATQELTQSMQSLSPVELSTVINTQLQPAAQRDGATERESMQLEIAQKLLTTMSEKTKSDPISWAAQTGMAVNALDFNKPESLPARVAAAEAISQKYNVPVEKALFSQSEKLQLINSLEEMPDTQKLALGKQMQAGFGRHFTKAIGELAEKDPVFAQSTFLSSLSPANDILALDILRGQRILKAEPKLKPSDVNKTASLAALGNAFEYMPRAVPGIVASADALYAKRVGLGEFDKGAYDQAILDVLGATKDGKGGIGSLNDSDYLLPQQFDEDDFERGLMAMTSEDLASMSVGGGPPTWGKDETAWTGEKLLNSGVQFKTWAYGQYALYDANGKALTSKSGPDGLYILAIDPNKFSQIVRGANEKAQKEKESTYRSGGGL